LREERAERARRLHEENEAIKHQEKEDAEEARYWAGKTDADLKWIVDEAFVGDRINAPLEVLDVKGATWEKQTLNFAQPIITPKQRGHHVFATTKEEYDSFVVEMEYELQGCLVGISFNRQRNASHQWIADEAYTGYEQAEVNINGVVSRAYSRDLGWVQKVRYEKKGKHLSISIDKKIIFQNSFKKFTDERGKIGFFLKFSNPSQFNRAAMAKIKRFRLGIYK
jgi:hypothetical protein